MTPVRGRFSKQDYNKAQTIMGKMGDSDIIIKHFWVRVRDGTTKVEGKGQSEKRQEKHIIEKWLMPRIYKEVLQISKKKTTLLQRMG